MCFHLCYFTPSLSSTRLHVMHEKCCTNVLLHLTWFYKCLKRKRRRKSALKETGRAAIDRSTNHSGISRCRANPAHQLVALSSGHEETSLLPTHHCDGWRLKVLSFHPPVVQRVFGDAAFPYFFYLFGSSVFVLFFCLFFWPSTVGSNKRGEIKVLREASGGIGEGSRRTKLIKLFIISVLKLY